MCVAHKWMLLPLFSCHRLLLKEDMSQILLKYFEDIIKHLDGNYLVQNVYSSFR